MAAKICFNDEVVVLAGKDKGKRGKIKKVLPCDKVIVEGVNVAKKHKKPNPALNQPGNIVVKELPIHVSNVALFNPKTGKGSRVGFQYSASEDNQKKLKMRCFKDNGDLIRNNYHKTEKN